ncbi:hypothetical protein BV372_19390 [Nostoc sp. T09]|uniref:pentapeptide repeat-containing protein n=1 Tax=Nostoc sp. T09 TaxID=1932621 RepID=UPI000A3C443C|nr:pentapeptide repeat-containing protein [Nostoc sp. T09]OUL32289.1 hypothetical protein BV372_19390 [Nostoc sp. T09]
MALDFSGQNLRGRNFKQQDLAGANFSYADIRGTNFTNANLTGANFSHTKAGLQKHWIFNLVFITLVLIVILGFITALTIRQAEEYYLSVEGIQKYSVFPGVIVYILLLIFAIITVHRGMETTFGATALAFAVAGVGTVAISGDKASFVVSIGIGVVIIAMFVALIASVGGAVIWADDWAVVQAVALSWFGSGTFFLVCLIIGSKIGTGFLAVAWTGGFALGGGLLANYFGWLILSKNQKFTLIQQTVAIVIATGGTSFRNANLTDANFTHAKLKSTDFRNANLTHTCWFQAQKLNMALIGTTYLEKLLVQKLLTTRKGQDKNFDGLSLRGVNLCSANLADASFIGADLSEANLQDADLSRAKLKQTQLDATDLTGATLTGAFIEDWGITSETKLHGVRCEYIFMRLPTKENPDPHRKPDNKQEVFKDGDFGDFIKPIFDTLDLYHSQSVDPRAIAIAFKNLAENHPEAELEIVAMEKRGNDKFLLKAKTAPGSDKSQLSAEYFDDYNQLKALSQSQQLLLIEKDSYIHDLKNMLTTALGQSKYYIQGDNKVSDISGINIQGSSNVSGIAGGGSVANLGTISGNVSIALNQLPDAPEAEKPGIKELLTQLQAAISQSPELSADDKAEALEQVQTLAEAAKNPQENATKKTAKTAITMLKGIFTGLPAVASLVEAGNKLLPLISKLFGLG